MRRPCYLESTNGEGKTKNPAMFGRCVGCMVKKNLHYMMIDHEPSLCSSYYEIIPK